MFAYTRVQKPGLGIRQHSGERGIGPNGQPISFSTLCHCSCHPPQKPPPAVEARLCQECADERFQSWYAVIEEDRMCMNDIDTVKEALRCYRKQIDPAVEAVLIQPAAEAAVRLEAELTRLREENKRLREDGIMGRDTAYRRRDAAEAENARLREDNARLRDIWPVNGETITRLREALANIAGIAAVAGDSDAELRSIEDIARNASKEIE